MLTMKIIMLIMRRYDYMVSRKMLTTENGKKPHKNRNFRPHTYNFCCKVFSCYIVCDFETISTAISMPKQNSFEVLHMYL